MDLAIYNRSNTKANVFAEAVYLRIAMMYSNEVYTSSFISEMLIKWHLRHQIPDHYLCRMHDLFYPEEIQEGCSNFKDWFKTLKELRKIKHKDKAVIVVHQKMENLMKLVKQDVFDFYERFLNLHKLHAPLKFYELGMIAYVKNKVKDGDERDPFGLTLMNSEDYSEESKEEDPLLKHIIDGFIEYEQSLVFDSVIEELVSFSRLDEGNIKEDSFFFSIPLFNFPHLQDLTYEQLKNIRDELIPIVEPWHEEYEKFQKELITVPFENSQAQIKTLLNTYITPYLKAIQHKIDENLFAQQQKSKYGADQYIKVMLGITSIENQIHLLEKEGVLLPFVANTIMEKLEKGVNIKACYPFIYHKIKTTLITQ